MTNKKRILALAAAIVILMSCLVMAIVPASASDVMFLGSFYTTYFDGNQISTGASPYPWPSLYDMIYEYHSQASNVYYFELQNTIQGGTPYAPNSDRNWFLPYQFDQVGFGVGNPIFRFYLPYDDNVINNSWDFEIRTVLGNVVFDSQGQNMTQDDRVPNRGFYTFEVSSNILGITDGWYIYCDQLPPVPIIDNLPTYRINFNYTYNGTSVFNNVILRTRTVDAFTLDVPPIPNYVIETGYEQHYFPSLLSDVTVNIPVKTIQDVINQGLSQFVEIRAHYFGGELSEGVYEDFGTLSFYVKKPSTRYSNVYLPFPVDRVNFDLNTNGYPFHYVLVDFESVDYENVIRLDIYTDSYLYWAMNNDTVKLQVEADYRLSDEYKDALAAAEREGYENGLIDGGSEININPLNFFIRPVASFFAIEPYPGLPIGIIFVAAVAISLVVIFLKIFAGG